MSVSAFKFFYHFFYFTNDFIYLLSHSGVNRQNYGQNSGFTRNWGCRADAVLLITPSLPSCIILGSCPYSDCSSPHLVSGRAFVHREPLLFLLFLAVLRCMRVTWSRSFCLVWPRSAWQSNSHSIQGRRVASGRLSVFLESENLVSIPFRNRNFM